MTLATQTSPLPVSSAAHIAVHSVARTLRAPSRRQNLAERLFGVRGLSSAAIGTALAVAAFVNLEIVAIDAALVWSLASYFHLPAPFTITVALVLGVPTAWACWKVAKLALEAERGAFDDDREGGHNE